MCLNKILFFFGFSVPLMLEALLCRFEVKNKVSYRLEKCGLPEMSCVSLVCYPKNVLRGCVKDKDLKAYCRKLLRECSEMRGTDSLCVACKSDGCNSRENDRLFKKSLIAGKNEKLQFGFTTVNNGDEQIFAKPTVEVPKKSKGQQKANSTNVVSSVPANVKAKIIYQIMPMANQNDFLSGSYESFLVLVKLMLITVAIFGIFLALMPSEQWLCDPFLRPSKYPKKTNLLHEEFFKKSIQ